MFHYQQKPKLCKEKTESRKGKRLYDNQEDSKFKRNYELGRSEYEPALIPSK
jgi:hypothetical protein